MRQQEVTLPRLGESITEAVVVRWLKKEGDLLLKDAPLVEVATDKVASEIPAPCAGVLRAIYTQEGQTVQIGEKLCLLESTEDAACPFFSPRVLHMAREAGLSLEKLAEIPATGNAGRITASDVTQYIQKRPMSSLFEKAARTLPQATMMAQADVTDLMEHIAREKQAGRRATPTAYLLYALAKMVKSYPLLNAHYQEGTRVLEKIDVGLAVDRGEEGLKVALVKDLAHLELDQIAERIRAIVAGVEESGIPSILVTNFGASGALWGTPMLVPPQVAIFGMGAIVEQPAAYQGKIALRKMVNLLISFDHRVCDGMYAGRALTEVAKILQSGEAWLPVEIK